LAVIAVCWLPYLALRIYWHNLLEINPSAEHGEVSGLILFLLPRLLIFAASVTFIGLAYCVIAIRYRHPLGSNG
jgi:hypothetical protein